MIDNSDSSHFPSQEGRKKFSYRKVSNHNEKSMDNKFSKDPGIYFSREDKFEGKFEWKNGLILKRGYLQHTPWTKIYHTRIHSRRVAPVAQVVVIHGWASSSNFVEIGCQFAKNGIIAHLFDMRGFGYSGGLRRNSKIKHFLEDLHLVINQCFNDLPLFLYGHSLGGFIAMNYLLLNKINVSGVLFTSPFVAVPISWKITKFKEIMMKILGPVMEVSFFPKTVFNLNRNVS